MCWLSSSATLYREACSLEHLSYQWVGSHLEGGMQVWSRGRLRQVVAADTAPDSATYLLLLSMIAVDIVGLLNQHLST